MLKINLKKDYLGVNKKQLTVLFAYFYKHSNTFQYIKVTKLPKSFFTNKSFYIKKGVFRNFILDQHGKEFTLEFYEKGNFIIHNQENTDVSGEEIFIEIIEDTTLEIISQDLFFSQTKNVEGLEVLMNMLFLKYINFLNERTNVLQRNNIEDKYSFFLKHYSQLSNKIPLHYVASYLGITTESLSRIRRKMLLAS